MPVNNGSKSIPRSCSEAGHPRHAHHVELISASWEKARRAQLLNAYPRLTTDESELP